MANIGAYRARKAVGAYESTGVLSCIIESGTNPGGYDYAYTSIAAFITGREDSSVHEYAEIIDSWTNPTTARADFAVGKFSGGATVSAIGDAFHDGAWNTSAFRMVHTSDARAIVIRVPNITINGLQIDTSATAGAAYDSKCVMFIGDVEGCVVENCLLTSIKGSSSFGYAIYGSDLITAASTVSIKNNIIFESGRGIVTEDSQITFNCDYNSIYDLGSRGIYNISGTMVCRNNIVFSTALDYSGTLGGTNNFSEDATAPGSGSLINQSDPFTNAASGIFTLTSGTNALDAGVLISGIVTDIIGTSRPQGSGSDMGAYERIVTSGTDTDLVLSGSSHLQEAGALVLLAKSNLSMNASEQVQEADNITLTSAAEITLANSEQVQEADNVVLSISKLLILTNSEQTQEAETVVLVSAAELTLAASEQIQEAGVIDLVYAAELAVANSEQAQETNNIVLSINGLDTELVIAEISQLQEITIPDVYMVATLNMNDLIQLQESSVAFSITAKGLISIDITLD